MVGRDKCYTQGLVFYLALFSGRQTLMAARITWTLSRLTNDISIRSEITMLFRMLQRIAIAIGVIISSNGLVAVAQDKPALEGSAENKVSDLAGQWGHLAGQIVIRGDSPKPVLEDLTDAPEKDLSIALVDGKIPFDDGIVVSEKKQLRDVFVMMYVRRGAKLPEKFHPSYGELKKESVPIVIQNCRFHPHAIFARSGQTLAYTNKDDVGYNCPPATFQQGHSLNLPAGSKAELGLQDLSDLIPGEIRCDVHPWMDAVIFIRDNPYVAISSNTGAFRIDNIPVGDWQFQFWHKRAGYLKTLEIKGYEVNRRGVIDGVKIENDKTLDLGILTLPVKAFDD